MTLTSTQEYILTHYPISHNPEAGKRMSRQQLLLLTGQLKKEKYDDSEILDWLLYFDTLGKPVAQRAACKWMCDCAITLPEDEYKVLQAVKVARLNHVDPLRYSNPMEIIFSFPRVREKLKPIDPRTLDTLHFRYNNGKGMDIYDVDETEESRENMRRIIDTHFGVDCNPWCLLAADEEGRLTKGSASYWRYYSGFPKRVAFLNGRLHAFSAGSQRQRVWWDRWDLPHGGKRWGIRPVPNDPLHRRAQYETDLFTGVGELHGGFFRGSKENGLCERFRSLGDTEPYSREFYCNGKRLMQTWKGLTYANKKALDKNSDWEKGIFRIPESFKKIPDRAFSNAKKLTEIYIPDTVQSLGNRVFEGCSSLRTVRLPSNLTKIPDGMFRGCSSLRSIILPATVVEIGENAFFGCSDLVGIQLPEKLTFIAEGTFRGCSSLETISIPESVREIRKEAFCGCSSLREIQLPKQVESIGKGAFGGCSFKQVTIPDTVTSIQDNAFPMCLNLQSLIVCKRWYGMFRERYGRRVRLLNIESSTKQKCA